MNIDKTRPYGSIHGDYEGSTRFEQDGKQFDAQGEEIIDEVAAKKAAEELQAKEEEDRLQAIEDKRQKDLVIKQKADLASLAADRKEFEAEKEAFRLAKLAGAPKVTGNQAARSRASR